MKLLQPFDIDSFCRVVWVSKAARDMWEKPIQEVNQFVQELEITSVVEGQRPCSWQTISESELSFYTRSWSDMGLKSLPIKRVGTFGGFAHKHTEPKNDGTDLICVILSKDMESALEFKKAFESGDNDKQGELLGFPSCCRKFFCDTWKDGYYDPMWQAALQSNVVDKEERKLHIKAHPLSISTLRYIGIRVSFHITHSFNCEKTIEIASQRLELADKVDHEKTELLKALLLMPHSWDVNKGIAVVKTPLFYIITSSVPSIEKHVIEVEYENPFFPKESVKGTSYPFTEVNSG